MPYCCADAGFLDQIGDRLGRHGRDNTFRNLSPLTRSGVQKCGCPIESDMTLGGCCAKLSSPFAKPTSKLIRGYPTIYIFSIKRYIYSLLERIYSIAFASLSSMAISTARLAVSKSSSDCFFKAKLCSTNSDISCCLSKSIKGRTTFSISETRQCKIIEPPASLWACI